MQIWSIGIGLVGIVFGAVSLWYARRNNRRNSEAHEILTRHEHREEEERQLSRRKKELLREANELASQSQSASTLLIFALPLESDLDRRAGQQLASEGHATLDGEYVKITVNKMPPSLRRGVG